MVYSKKETNTHTMHQKGFTLLEILLVIALIGIISLTVIVAVNPARQLEQTRNAERSQELVAIYQAVLQYGLESGEGLPSAIPVGDSQSDYREICRQGVAEATCIADGLVFLQDDLVPAYLSEIPEDPTRANVGTPNGTGYEIKVSTTNVVSLGSRSVENDEIISHNDDSYVAPN